MSVLNDNDMLSLNPTAPVNEQSEASGKDAQAKGEGARLEKPFSGENTLEEPVSTTLVGTSNAAARSEYDPLEVRLYPRHQTAHRHRTRAQELGPLGAVRYLSPAQSVRATYPALSTGCRAAPYSPSSPLSSSSLHSAHSLSP